MTHDNHQPGFALNSAGPSFPIVVSKSHHSQTIRRVQTSNRRTATTTITNTNNNNNHSSSNNNSITVYPPHVPGQASRESYSGKDFLHPNIPQTVLDNSGQSTPLVLFYPASAPQSSSSHSSSASSPLSSCSTNSPLLTSFSSLSLPSSSPSSSSSSLPSSLSSSVSPSSAASAANAAFSSSPSVQCGGSSSNNTNCNSSLNTYHHHHHHQQQQQQQHYAHPSVQAQSYSNWVVPPTMSLSTTNSPSSSSLFHSDMETLDNNNNVTSATTLTTTNNNVLNITATEILSKLYQDDTYGSDCGKFTQGPLPPFSVSFHDHQRSSSTYFGSSDFIGGDDNNNNSNDNYNSYHSNSRSSSCSSEFDDEDEAGPSLTELVNIADITDACRYDLVGSMTTLFPQEFQSEELIDLKDFMKSEPMDETAFLKTDMDLYPSEFGISESDSDGYDSSYEQPGCSSLPNPGYEQLDSYRQITGFPNPSPWNRQSPSEADEGFVDGPGLPENLPYFEKIQHPSTENETTEPSRRASASPKARRKTNDSPQITDKERRKPGRKPGQVSNVLHLWEFMRDLLHSPDSKGIIEWISKPEGVFRVLNSTEVAKLWGKKKKNKKEMTYEKLSRSLRYSRLEGYFSNLPKDKNYPKKLCFKFGPKSKNWH